MAHWLLKTEPSEYSWERLEREGKATWDGVANPVAVRNLKSAKRGDDVVVYHTADVKAARSQPPDSAGESGARSPSWRCSQASTRSQTGRPARSQQRRSGKRQANAHFAAHDTPYQS